MLWLSSQSFEEFSKFLTSFRKLVFDELRLFGVILFTSYSQKLTTSFLHNNFFLFQTKQNLLLNILIIAFSVFFIIVFFFKFFNATNKLWMCPFLIKSSVVRLFLLLSGLMVGIIFISGLQLIT